MKKIILVWAFFFAFAAAIEAKETLLDKEIASCQRIGYPEWRDDCFESLGKTAKNYALCVKITNKERQALCFAAYPPQNIADCQLNQVPKEFDACLIALKQTTQDFSLCKKISNIELRKDCYACSSSEKDIPVCLEFRAKQLRDKTICDLLHSTSAKSNCLAQMNTKSTVVGCEEPQNLLDFKLCKQFTIAQNEEIKNSKKNAKKVKTQKFDQAKETKSQQQTEKIQQAKEKQAQKIQEAKDKQAVLKAEKDAKVQQSKEDQATKIRRDKEKRDIKAQEIAEKLQQNKDKQAQRIQEAKDKQDAIKAEKEAKIQQAKDAKRNKSVAKVEAISKPKENNVITEVPDIKNALVEETEEEFLSSPMSYSTSAEEISQKPQEPALPAPIKIEKASKVTAEEKSVKINKAKEVKAQEKADKIRKIKEQQETQAQEKAEEIRKAKEQQAAKAQEKADKARKAREARLKTKKVSFIDESYETDPNQFQGCTKGFGTWTEPPPSRNEQMICDKENIEQFKPLVNRCLTTDRGNVLIMSYDVNKDGCVTCADLNQWKTKVTYLYHAKKRSTDARYLYVKECQDRKF